MKKANKKGKREMGLRFIRCRVLAQGLSVGFRVWVLGFRVTVSWFTVLGLEFRVCAWGIRLGVWEPRFGEYGLEFRILGFRVYRA